MARLRIEKFAHIAKVDMTLADLTVLVGAQGTGKSLALQCLKTAFDGKYMVEALREAGHYVTPVTLVDQIFGVGMGRAWSDSTAVSLGQRDVAPSNISRIGDGTESVFF